MKVGDRVSHPIIVGNRKKRKKRQVSRTKGLIKADPAKGDSSIWPVDRSAQKVTRLFEA